MCLSERENLLYELGQPADLQHGLEACLLGDDYDPTEALVLKNDLERVCRSNDDLRWRLRRVVKRVLLAAATTELEEPGRVRSVLARLHELLGENLLKSYLHSFKPQLKDQILAHAS